MIFVFTNRNIFYKVRTKSQIPDGTYINNDYINVVP